MIMLDKYDSIRKVSCLQTKKLIPLEENKNIQLDVNLMLNKYLFIIHLIIIKIFSIF